MHVTGEWIAYLECAGPQHSALDAARGFALPDRPEESGDE